MNRSVAMLVALLSIVAMLATGLGAPGPRAAQAQAVNLLASPGFEGTYVAVGIYENMRVAAGWIAWWREGSREEFLDGYRMKPEYKAAFADEAPGNRVHSGWESQQYFHSFANFQGGILQIVNGVQPGQRLRFSMWGMAWSCEHYSRCHTNDPPEVWSWHPADMHMRIGIDPFGGNDPFSTNIIWSPEKNSYDVWDQWTVEAVAAARTVTVWTYAYPDYRNQDNDIYLDDAELIVVGTGSPPSGGTTPPAQSTVVPQSTPVPPRTGETSYEVEAGDTLSAIGLHFGVSWQAIAQRNNLANPNYLYIGQILIIPAP